MNHPTVATMASLLTAAQEGDLARVEELFSTKVSASQKPEILSSLAALAAQSKQPDLLTWCFDHGLVLDSTPNNEIFKRAVHAAHIPTFSVLVSHGLDLNAQHLETAGDALTAAADDGNVELVRWLLEHGHKPDSKVNMSGDVALTAAVQGREPSIDVLKLLIEHGADINGSGAVIAAAEEGELEALRVLVQTGKADLECSVLWYGVTDRESIDAEGTALYRACYKGQLKTARYLIECGADKGAKDTAGRSCRDAAVAGEYEDVVRLLDGTE